MKPTDLRGILQYIPQFREKTFILAVDGAIVTDENFATLLLDVAVLRSLNIRVVLVHGASAQIRALADEQKITPSDLDGSGITDAGHAQNRAHRREPADARDSRRAFGQRPSRRQHKRRHRAPDGHSPGSGPFIHRQGRARGHRIAPDVAEQGIIPVIPPLGFDGDGRTYRFNSDAVALAVAEALKAIKLIFITTPDGILVQGRVIRQMPVADLESVIALQKNDIAPEQLSKALHAVAACKAGVPRVHIINGRVDEGLLAEVFSNEGIGTLIYANDYQQIRRAMKKDVRAIQLLTKAAVESEELVKRTRAMIEKNLGDYFIFEIDKNPVACVALHVYPEQKKGELACLYVNPLHENRGIGRKLIQYIENKAREMNLTELLTLSTQAFTYFQSKGGFAEGTPDDLPPARREKYEQSGRNSRCW